VNKLALQGWSCNCRFLVFTIPAFTFNIQNSTIIPAYPMNSLHRHVGLILIFLEALLLDRAYVHGTSRIEVLSVSITFTANAIDTLCDCCGSLSGLVFMRELMRVPLVLKIFIILYRFHIAMRLSFSETPFTYGIYTEHRGFSSLLGRMLLPLS
jgi:hypothetical protein